VITFGGKQTGTHELVKPATVVGRDPGVDIVIDNLGVSRSHCQFIKRGGGFVVQDMNSANGTYVNGKKVGEKELADNDQVVVGKYAITFKAGVATQASAAAAPASPATAPVPDKLMPDSLNTYMMDGDKIKERLEEMRRQEEAKKAAAAGEAPARQAPAPAAPTPPPAVPATTRAPAPTSAPHGPERHTRIVMGESRGGGLPSGTIKRYLYFSLALNVVLVAACGILYYLYYTAQGS
jgi:predicted component of type VI protein secretion system